MLAPTLMPVVSMALTMHTGISASSCLCKVQSQSRAYPPSSAKCAPRGIYLEGRKGYSSMAIQTAISEAVWRLSDRLESSCLKCSVLLVARKQWGSYTQMRASP